MEISMDLMAWAKTFDQLYGRRNQAFQTLESMALFLQASWRDLQGALRDDRPDQIRRALANIMGWTFAICNIFRSRFNGVPLNTLMSRKYHNDGCANCGKKICDCPWGNRPPTKVTNSVSPEQEGWTLLRWQTFLAERYGERNKGRGTEWVLNRLCAEIAEVGASIVTRALRGETIAEIEEHIGFELTDVIAWTCAVATVLELDLEPIVSVRYGRNCPDCRDIPCICGALARERLQFARPRAIKSSS